MQNNLPFDKGMIVRTAVLVVALINQFLVNAGYSPLPFDNANVEYAATTALTIAASVWVWWKDNNVTYKARQADKIAKQRRLK
jgi:SPP1 family holin